jgi:hypothetical protein
MKKLAKMFWVLALGASLPAVGYGEDTLDLAGLKAKCAELTQNSQLKPFKIQVTCRQEIQQWRSAPSAEKPLTNVRTVGGSLRMKNYDVGFVDGAQPITDTAAPCAVVEKWKSVVPAVDLEISCDELTPIENISDYCTPIIEQRIQEDPSIVTEASTGEMYNTCAPASNGRGVVRN